MATPVAGLRIADAAPKVTTAPNASTTAGSEQPRGAMILAIRIASKAPPGIVASGALP
jgi:hypothetical protein